MKRTLTIGVCATAALTLSAGPALAGEWNAQGERTGAYEKPAKSECFFSGLDEDFATGTSDADPFTHTQNFGQLVRMFGPMGGVPGTACNGHLNPYEPGGEH